MSGGREGGFRQDMLAAGRRGAHAECACAGGLPWYLGILEGGSAATGCGLLGKRDASAARSLMTAQRRDGRARVQAGLGRARAGSESRL